MLIFGDATDETDDRGRPIKGETLLLIVNASVQPVTYKLPHVEGDGIWAELIDAAHRELRVITTGTVNVEPFSLALLRYGENRRMSNG
jgi:glycogen operon protein